MGKLRIKYFSHGGVGSNQSTLVEQDKIIYVCRKCMNHLAKKISIISKDFRGRTGKAYLISDVVNVSVGPPEDKQLLTGLHKVADIFCLKCFSNLGWTYIKAFDSQQKYKEGKFILEKARIKQFNDVLCDEKAWTGGSKSFFESILNHRSRTISSTHTNDDDDDDDDEEEEEHDDNINNNEEEEEEETNMEEEDDEEENAVFVRFHNALASATSALGSGATTINTATTTQLVDASQTSSSASYPSSQVATSARSSESETNEEEDEEDDDDDEDDEDMDT